MLLLQSAVMAVMAEAEARDIKALLKRPLCLRAKPLEMVTIIPGLPEKTGNTEAGAQVQEKSIFQED